MPRHDAIELGECIDLLDDDAAHLRGAVGRLLRQFEDALAQFGASLLHLALHRGAHLAHLPHDLDEALAGLAEQRGGLAGRLLVDRVQGFRGALALLVGGHAHQLVLVGDRLGAFGRGFGQHTRDVARAALGRLEGFGEQAREALEPLVEIADLAVDLVDHGVEGLTPIGENLLGAAIARVDLLGRRGQRFALRIELLATRAQISRRIVPVPAWNAFICSSKREFTAPLRSPMSFIVATNSATRPDSAVSIVLRFCVAPPSTSCSSTFASRSRSNSAEVSLRSMPCVSIISVTAADAAFCERSIAPRAEVSSSETVRPICALALALASLICEVMFSLVCTSPLAKVDALRVDRLHGLMGDALDLGRELLALRAEGAEERAGLLVKHAAQVGAALIDVGGQLLGLRRHAARDLGADAKQQALDLAGILLQRGGDAGRDRGQRALGFAGAALDRAGHFARDRADLARRLVGAGAQRFGGRRRKLRQRALQLARVLLHVRRDAGGSAGQRALGIHRAGAHRFDGGGGDVADRMFRVLRGGADCLPWSTSAGG